MALPLTPLFLRLEQFQKDNGDPAALYKLYFYLAGLTTTTVVYTDVNGTVPASNPYVLDAQGRTADTLYYPPNIGIKIIYTDENGPASPTPIPPGGVTLSTDDNLAAVGANAVAALGELLSQGTDGVVSGYVCLPTDNYVTALPAASPSPCVITLDTCVTDAPPFTFVNKATNGVSCAVSPVGVQTFNGVAGAVTVPAGTSPIFAGFTAVRDGVSNWKLTAWWT